MMDKIRAPFMAYQVEALNRWQDRDDVHPFTCGRSHGGHGVILRATKAGWVCPAEPRCDYTQDWAHAFMLVEPSQIIPARVGPSDEGKAIGSAEELFALLTTERLARQQAEQERERLRTALESIANNSCCTPCREAGMFARSALKAISGPETTP